VCSLRFFIYLFEQQFDFDLPALLQGLNLGQQQPNFQHFGDQLNQAKKELRKLGLRDNEIESAAKAANEITQKLFAQQFSKQSLKDALESLHARTPQASKSSKQQSNLGSQDENGEGEEEQQLDDEDLELFTL
jgi:ribosomal protein L12E/L44/L45/RPP1/RPP2